MYQEYVEDRCEVLVEHGLVEQISGEVVYRTTELGDQYRRRSEQRDPRTRTE